MAFMNTILNTKISPTTPPSGEIKSSGSLDYIFSAKTAPSGVNVISTSPPSTLKPSIPITVSVDPRSTQPKQRRIPNFLRNSTSKPMLKLRAGAKAVRR